MGISSLKSFNPLPAQQIQQTQSLNRLVQRAGDGDGDADDGGTAPSYNEGLEGASRLLSITA